VNATTEDLLDIHAIASVFATAVDPSMSVAVAPSV
jgi:hypothetical protein